MIRRHQRAKGVALHPKAGPTSESVTPINQVTRNEDNKNDSPSLQDQILDHVSSLKALIKQHNKMSGTLIKPIRLSFEDGEGNDKGENTNEEMGNTKDEDLQNMFKEVLRSGKLKRLEDARVAQNVRANTRWPSKRLVRSVTEHVHRQLRDLRGKFTKRFSLRRRCFKDPMKVSKIVRRPNQRLADFKERWTDKMSYIQDTPYVMQISAFMSNSKCLELAKRFSDQVLKTVTEMMKRVDDFIKSKEVYRSTELPIGEFEKGQGALSGGTSHPVLRMERDDIGQTTITISINTKIIISRTFLLGPTTRGMTTNDRRTTISV
nr:reverse transcriptase domain-containing protein [Tanacetum cinerariifolium]